MATETTMEIAEQVKGYSKAQRMEVARELAAATPDDEKRELIRAASGGVLDGPSTVTNDKLWLTIIGAFSGVLGLSALVLAIGMFTKTDGSVKPELIFSLFTSVAGFLAGLLAPNPFKKDES